MARLVPPAVWTWGLFIFHGIIRGFFGPQPLPSGPDGFQIFGRHFMDKGDAFFTLMISVFGCYSCFKLVSLACSTVLRKKKQVQEE